MSETVDSIKQPQAQKESPDPKVSREALLRLRQLAVGLPQVDAAAVVRDVRDSRQT